MKVSGIVYAAIRADKDDSGREWIDINGISGVPDTPREAAMILDAKIPAWSAANPLVRVARIRMTEDV